MVARLQAKASQIGKILTTLEKKYDTSLESSDINTTPTSGTTNDNKKLSSGGTGTQSLTANNKLRHDLGPPVKKPHLKVDPIPPFNANKIRKSPSTSDNNVIIN